MRSLVLLCFVGCANLQVVPVPEAAEQHRPKTADGWELSLVRYRPVGPSTGIPVLLCHGITANERNMDLDADHSMARWLASKGREAWTMSVRGTGASDRVDPTHGRALPILFDHFWQHDLPTAIAHVRQVSGAEQLDYAGHSMGGLIAYAYLSHGGTGLHAVATLGTPVRLGWGTGVERLLTSIGPIVGRDEVLVPSEALAQLSAPFQTLGDDSLMERLLYQPGSTSKETWQRLVRYGTADTAGGVIRQLLVMLGSASFRAELASVRTPVLVIAGKLDRLALTPAVKDGFHALGGPRQFRLITAANGAHGEYGHMDLVIGEHAAEDVFPHVLGFFDSPGEGEGPALRSGAVFPP